MILRLNLLPEEMRKKEVPKLLDNEQLQKLVRYFIIGFVGIQILLGVLAMFKALELNALKSQTQNLRPQLTETLQQKSAMDAMRARLGQIAKIREARFYWWNLLNAITNDMTKGVWLTGFTIGEGEESTIGKKVEAPVAKKLGKQKGGDKTGGVSASKYLRLDGSAVGAGQETAYIGKFISQLKSDPLLQQIFETIEPANITQKKIREYDVYDFAVICRFRKGWME